MKGFKLLMVAALATVWMSSCTEGTEQVSKPIGHASGDVAQTTSNTDKTTGSYDALQSQKADAKAKEKDNTSSELLPKTSIQFDSNEHDFGVIDEGDRVEHLFKFTNTGTEPFRGDY